MFLDSIISILLFVVFTLQREILPWKTSWLQSSQWPLTSCFDPYGYVTSFVRLFKAEVSAEKLTDSLTFFFLNQRATVN